MKLTVVFDGHCGVCTRIVRIIKGWDKRDALTFRTCQSLPDRGWNGIRRMQCNLTIFAVAEDGSTTRGSEAMMLILTVALNNAWPYRIGQLPGIRQVLHRGYRWVAKNRRKLPGETPWCQQHPEDCVPDALNPQTEEVP